jgi:hypothetical protein
MRCLSCKYDLQKLSPGSEGLHRCPECGYAFDPDLPFTYEKPRSLRCRRPNELLLLLGLGAFIVAWFLEWPRYVSLNTGWMVVGPAIVIWLAVLFRWVRRKVFAN